MERYLPEDLPDGADFLHLFRRETKAFQPWIRAEKTDLLEASWDGGEIEILFVVQVTFIGGILEPGARGSGAVFCVVGLGLCARG